MLHYNPMCGLVIGDRTEHTYVEQCNDHNPKEKGMHIFISSDAGPYTDEDAHIVFLQMPMCMYHSQSSTINKILPLKAKITIE
eukprot:5110181-Karenia_brevis.AAC.1